MTELEQESEHRPLPNPFDMTSTDGHLLEGLERELEHTAPEEGDRSPNFPVFYPLVYHNIRVEISPRLSGSVKLMYWLTLSFSMCLLTSFVASLFSGGMSSCDTSMNGFSWGKELFMSLFHLLVFPAVMWFAQYWPYYKATKADDLYIAAETVQIFAIGIVGVFMLGIPGTGMVGFLYMVSAFKNGNALNRLFSLVITLWHGSTFIGEIFLYGLLRTPQVTNEANLLIETPA